MRNVSPLRFGRDIWHAMVKAGITRPSWGWPWQRDFFILSRKQILYRRKWDVLGLLLRGETLKFDDSHSILSRRGVTEEVHAGNFKELVWRGWVKEGSGVYQITSAGRQVRAEVEAEAGHFFLAPWECWIESELEELSSLASQLRDGLGEGKKKWI